MAKTVHIEACPVCEGKEFKTFLSCSDLSVSSEKFDICKCADCGFAFTQDFPAESEIGKYYESNDYVSHSDTHEGLINKLYHQVRKIALRGKAKTVERYSSAEASTLLDVGSATGYFLNEMCRCKWVVTGVEVSDGARAFAKQKFDLDTQDAEYLYKIKEGNKDVITMWHVLEHMEDLNKVMARLHRILKDDGIAVIALPNKDSYDAQAYGEYWAAYDVPRHLWHFSPDDFTRFATKHDFEVVAIKPMYFDSFYISMLSEKYKGTFCGSLVGLMKGGIYFLKNLANHRGSSSLTYILKKKK